jgi:hypothetical protein
MLWPAELIAARRGHDEMCSFYAVDGKQCPWWWRLGAKTSGRPRDRWLWMIGRLAKLGRGPRRRMSQRANTTSTNNNSSQQWPMAKCKFCQLCVSGHARVGMQTRSTRPG